MPCNKKIQSLQCGCEGQGKGERDEEGGVKPTEPCAALETDIGANIEPSNRSENLSSTAWHSAGREKCSTRTGGGYEVRTILPEKQATHGTATAQFVLTDACHRCFCFCTLGYEERAPCIETEPK